MAMANIGVTDEIGVTVRFSGAQDDLDNDDEELQQQFILVSYYWCFYIFRETGVCLLLLKLDMGKRSLRLKAEKGGEAAVKLEKEALVRRQRQGCWYVYCIAAVGQMRTDETWDTNMAAARVDAQCRNTI